MEYTTSGEYTTSNEDGAGTSGHSASDMADLVVLPFTGTMCMRKAVIDKY